MTAPLKTIDGSDVAALMHEIGQHARTAARVLALAPTADKDAALAAMAAAIRAHKGEILAANTEDVADARRRVPPPPWSTAWRSTTSGSRPWRAGST